MGYERFSARINGDMELAKELDGRLFFSFSIDNS